MDSIIAHTFFTTLAKQMNEKSSPAAGASIDSNPTPTVPTSDLHDHYMDKPESHLRVAAPGLISFGGKKSYSGRITTLASAGDIPLRLRDILSEPGQGRVLVVEGRGITAEWALLGDRMAFLGSANDWAGIVLHGYVRDVAALRDLPFGVHALGSIPSRPRWPEVIPVERDIPLVFHRVRFVPGHWLYADEDGILVAEHELGI
jgi:regulator of ribonuclease activity A